MTKVSCLLIAVSAFFAGGVLGGLSLGQYFPPVTNSPFLVTYSTLIAAIVAAIAAAVVVAQIIFSERQHRALVLEAREQRIRNWIYTDRALATVGETYAKDCRKRLDDLFNANPGLEQLLEVDQDPPNGIIPEACQYPPEPPPHRETMLNGASPLAAATFLSLADAIDELQRFMGREPRGEVSPISGVQGRYISELARKYRRGIALQENLRLAADLTKPAGTPIED